MFSTMSSAEGLKAGLRGKTLRVAHYYRDFLWYLHEINIATATVSRSGLR